ncbi:UDP-glucose dehydrogenase family protein [Micromonospora sp. NPDC051925]|uniref:UDP-glucose dehydrogenase family protein n=1 Tax=Micromonospora sp. NPDC051925 TaxID=3364288 RepID=UPI0037C7DD1A
MKITVIGCGRLGAPYAAGLAALGHEVLGLDSNTDTASLLDAGKPPFAEPGLAEAITEGAATGGLTFTSSYAKAAAHAAVHFIAVPTPQAMGAAHHDLTDVFAAAEALAREITRDIVVVIKSSVPAGTSARVKQRMMAVAPAGVRVEVAASPDFMREAHSISDVRRPTRIVLGVEHGGRAENLLRQVWSECLADGVPLVVTDLATAELCKLAANAFLATRVSFVNALSEFCEAAGANVEDLAAAIGHDKRIGAQYLMPGLGFGGSCLTKDIRGFVALAQSLGVGESLEFLTKVDAINQGRRERAVQLARQAAGGDLSGCRVGVWGASFKAGIDDVRDSPALDVAVRLHQAGAVVSVYDPQAMDNARAEHPYLSYVTDAAAAAQEASVLLHLTNWAEFGRLSPAQLAPSERPTLVDARRGLLRHPEWEAAGWTVQIL